jgi:hypothetical protein
MRGAIVPKSDQLNADDLIAGPITIKVAQVTIRGGQEQPVAISYENDGGKPYKPCKSMSRVLVTCWGADAKQYVGRSMTLYRDPTVKWAGMDVGGIRISHLTDIDQATTMALTATKGSRKPFTVRPLVVEESEPDPREGLAMQEIANASTLAGLAKAWNAIPQEVRNAELAAARDARKAAITGEQKNAQ